jgi:hypothetical protein
MANYTLLILNVRREMENGLDSSRQCDMHQGAALIEGK